MVGKIGVFAGLFFVLSMSSLAETRSCTFEFQNNGMSIPVMALQLDLEGSGLRGSNREIEFFRLEGDKKIQLRSQLDNGHTSRLWFVMDKVVESGEKITFEARECARPAGQEKFTASMDENKITLRQGSKNILTYFRGLHGVPEGVDHIFRKSGFIHPLWSPGGEILTRIQPADHYHHYGIWAPWTKAKVHGRVVDFWNLGKGEGTVRYAGLLSVESGPVYCGFKVRQEHVDFKYPGGEKTVMTELLDVRGSESIIKGQKAWVVDYTSTLSNVLDEPIELVSYRYGGGLGYRARGDWTKETSSVLTSQGKNRSQADGTRARWCDINGLTGEDKYSGILFMSHLLNREHPEPMRVWPENMIDGRGELMFEFCPIRGKSWALEPGREYVLRYRMIVYDGKVDSNAAEALWRVFAVPPRITLKQEIQR